jgi:hypothetical protein
LKRVVLDKLTVAQVVTKFDQQSFFVLRANIKQRYEKNKMKKSSETISPFVESKGPLMYSQAIATLHYPDSNEFGGHPNGPYF